jgi:hypothetical protein
MGTAAMGEKLVMPATSRPKKIFTKPMVLRIDQLNSKYTGTEADDMVPAAAFLVNQKRRCYNTKSNTKARKKSSNSSTTLFYPVRRANDSIVDIKKWNLVTVLIPSIHPTYRFTATASSLYIKGPEMASHEAP